MNEKDFFEYVEAVCKHPKMYTTNGSFFEVISFLDGLAAGLNVGDLGYHMPLTPFRQWLGSKDNSTKDRYDWKNFREGFETDYQTLIALAQLYQEYISMKNN